MCALINKCISEGTFPDEIKKAIVTPVYKKKDHLEKANYRPVSILSTSSKIFEGRLTDQLSTYFQPIFSPCIPQGLQLPGLFSFACLRTGK
jgi:hypothetical protein